MPSSIPAALLRWYRRNRRELPWRATRDPYAIWVSEVMLQQTSVAAAVPRWASFLKRFPTLERLARASEEEVMAEWSGLGYYARARNLLAAARAIGSSSRFPRSARELEELPGFGPYTAAAVASIAFGEPVAALDTNALRVLARLLALADAGKAGGRRRLRDFAADLVAASSPGAHNQAVMELGATVCLSADPRCGVCPLAPRCAGYRSGEPARYGTRSRRLRPRKVALAAGLARRGTALLLVPDTEMVRGHMTLPSVVVRAGADPASALRAAWPRLAGRRTRAIEPCGHVSHAVLDRRYTVFLFRVEESSRGSAPPGSRLAEDGEILSLSRGSFLDKALALSRRDSRGSDGRSGGRAGRSPRARARPTRRGG